MNFCFIVTLVKVGLKKEERGKKMKTSHIRDRYQQLHRNNCIYMTWGRDLANSNNETGHKNVYRDSTMFDHHTI